MGGRPEDGSCVQLLQPVVERPRRTEPGEAPG